MLTYLNVIRTIDKFCIIFYFEDSVWAKRFKDKTNISILFFLNYSVFLPQNGNTNFIYSSPLFRNYKFLSSVFSSSYVLHGSTSETFINQSFLTTKQQIWFFIQFVWVVLGQVFKYIYLTFESVNYLHLLWLRSTNVSCLWFRRQHGDEETSF